MINDMKIVNVLGYEGLYAVTDEGDIYSLKKGRIKKKLLDKDGYYKVGLNKNGIQKTYKVHQIVYYSFNGKNNDDLVIDHINSIKTDNRLENLRKLTNRENSARNRTHKYGRGVRYFKKLDKFGATISINKERFHLGVFKSEEEAREAYKNACSNWEEKGILPFKPDRTVKLCKRCGRILPKSEFYYVKTHGSSWLCKECSKEAMRERRKKLNE